MKKSFCDKCGDEIKVDSEWVFGKELCPVCAEVIRDWLDGKTLELGCETEDKPIITDPECCGDIMVGSVTPLTFEDYCEAIIPEEK